ncbi:MULTISPECIES: PTS sugar transporter subunit IIA [unclassified Clostridioides]|uniref:PTS sugar transporter subunit IIA n=1 Tax=unclassified Clostridioides TaxID=2635829 RepID=UPI001379349A|nr:PTS sugar transporter subunit IIA [Clostridioides sp. ZZV14-6387]MCI9978007.1 PTS sugar transporter subunit IIA [Clostridioides difficile]NJI80413.1 PTS sugar transporter subunit IIA [Clostridioides difficile]NJJ36755.1 PTS sugar transporter subunit IIA [Clostridioides difficile]NJK16009.1 PTS sugar transporter subunit IIA [Clostridioides difficile]
MIHMAGIVIAAHGNMAKAMLESAELIVGKQEKVETLGLNHGDSIDDFSKRLENGIEKYKDEGVLLLLDFYGGTPFNTSAIVINKFAKVCELECLTGVNLPMLLELFLNRENMKLKELKNLCEEVGISGIKDVKAVLNI